MKTMIQHIFATSENKASLILRIILGSVLFAHGARNMTGWFGGGGFTNTMQYFTDTVGLAYIVGFLVISLQFFGAIFILIGFTTRLMALGILGMFTGMIVMVHLPHGFFMNWFGTNAGEGFEYHILVIGICSALLVLGGGAWSLDRKFVSLLAR
jgi:putative oxidoreductase